MNGAPLSDLFVDGGLLVTPDRAGQSIFELATADVIHAFERHGVLVFRGFELPAAELSHFTDRFTETYANDAPSRESRFEQRMVRNVTMGNYGIAMHSEAAYSPNWPELIWFFCNVPPAANGQTTLCDGIQLWSRVPRAIQATFLAQPLRYDIELPTGRGPMEGGKTREWPYSVPGVSGTIDNAEGVFRLSVERFAIQDSRLPRSHPSRDVPCFANYLLLCGLADIGSPMIKRVSMADGTPIDPAIVSEIAALAESLTFEHTWQPRDLVMLDNRRFMHGRRVYAPGDPRDIVQVQVARAGFGFGSSTRSPVRSA